MKKAIVYLVALAAAAFSLGLSAEEAMDEEYRQWKNANGKSTSAKWLKVSQDGKKIQLSLEKSKKNMKMSVSSLCEDDQIYVEAKIMVLKGEGYVWRNGLYVDPKTNKTASFADTNSVPAAVEAADVKPEASTAAQAPAVAAEPVQSAAGDKAFVR